VVIWVFSGGGYTEFGGLIIFLERNFPPHRFIRKTPVRQKPGPKPRQEIQFHVFGQTGQALADQVKYFLSRSDPEDDCEMILILDDLDCHDLNERAKMFLEEVNGVETFANKTRLVGFAKPEIEAWLVADWEGTFARNKDLCHHEENIRIKLKQAYRELTEGGDITDPENFSHYVEERDACQDKLSDTISQIVLDETGIHYSKSIHSSLLLRDARAEIISNRCPVFRNLYRQLKSQVIAHHQE
jgi:hypothetical protein